MGRAWGLWEQNAEGFGLPGVGDRACDKLTDSAGLVGASGDHEGGVVLPELLIFIS